MERFSKKTVIKLCEWLAEQNVPMEVIESFEENEMDGDALSTLIGTIPGPDCLKDLVPKVGVRLKVYQCIKTIYNKELSIDSLGIQDTSSATGSDKSSSWKVHMESDGSTSSYELKKLQTEIFALQKEKASLESELNKQKEVPVIDVDQSDRSSTLKIKKTSLHSAKGLQEKKTSSHSAIGSREKKASSHSAKETQEEATSSGSTEDTRVMKLPNPFPIPMFRVETEARLKRKFITEQDRKYMIQTLATVMMTHVQKPSLADCQVVSMAVHKKFKFLGGESSESAWKWFLYNRCQNVNKKKPDGSPPKKKLKLEDTSKHVYPSIPALADDETSNSRNIELLKEECKKSGWKKESMKELMARTYATRRVAILNNEYPTTSMIIDNYPILKRCTYAKYEFELVMQRSNMKEEFDEQLLLWSKAILLYCKKTCTTTTAIQTLVKNIDAEYDGETLIVAIRCLALLLIPGKTKSSDGDIPCFIRFVSNDTPPSQAVEASNSQPHLVVFRHEEYDQYFVAVEQQLCMECTDLSMALFLLLAAHYIFNLSYHTKTTELMKFLQEKVAGIDSATKSVKKLKSPVATQHVNAIATEYKTLLDRGSDNASNEVDSDSE